MYFMTHEAADPPLLLRNCSASRPGSNGALPGDAGPQRATCDAVHRAAASRVGPQPDYNGTGGGPGYRPDHGHADVGADQEGWPCKRYGGTGPSAAPLGTQCRGAGAAEATDAPLAGRAGGPRETFGTSGSRGTERRIVPRRQQTLLELNPFVF